MISVENIIWIPRAARVMEITAVSTSESDPYPDWIHFRITFDTRIRPMKNRRSLR